MVKKVAIVIPRADTLGGAQRHVVDLMNGVSGSNVQFILIHGAGSVFDDCVVVKSSVSSRVLNSLTRVPTLWGSIQAVFAVRKILVKEGVDVLFLHSVNGGLVGRLANSFLNVKTVFTAHGWSHIRSTGSVKRYIYIYLERFLALKSDSIICVCENDCRYAIETIGIPKRKVKNVYNGVSDPQCIAIDSCDREILDVDGRVVPVSDSIGTDKPFVFGVVARFQQPKDFDTLLMAFSSVEQTNWILLLAGDGEELDFYKALVSRNEILNKRVYFLGFRSDLDILYRVFDCFVLVSRSEGLPYSILEALSYSLPVLATDVGGVSEMVSEVNGSLVKSEDYLTLSNAIEGVLSSGENELEQMGVSSRRLFLEKFSDTVMFRKLEKVLGV